jgi:hypothetical protein
MEFDSRQFAASLLRVADRDESGSKSRAMDRLATVPKVTLFELRVTVSI